MSNMPNQGAEPLTTKNVYVPVSGEVILANLNIALMSAASTLDE